MLKFVCTASLIYLASCSPREAVPVASDGALHSLISGEVRIVDLTYPLNAGTPHWPGPGNRPFSYQNFATLEKDQVFEGRFTMDEHTGTHIDAPNHFIDGQIGVDRLPVDQLLVPAAVIDVRPAVTENPDFTLTVSDIEQWEQANGNIPDRAVVLLYTGWDSRWTDFASYKNEDAEGVLHFPGFSAEAAEFLVEQRNIAGLGIDALSVDPGISQDFGVHLLSHAKGRYHLENVANLGLLPPTGAVLIVAPTKIEGGSGAPVRLLALVPQNR